ncbi:hypothetical protein EJB05_57403, partial [Eragrostis curvula]
MQTRLCPEVLHGFVKKLAERRGRAGEEGLPGLERRSVGEQGCAAVDADAQLRRDSIGTAPDGPRACRRRGDELRERSSSQASPHGGAGAASPPVGPDRILPRALSCPAASAANPILQPPPPAAARCEAGSKVMLKGMDYPELENWVQEQGFRPGQAMMLWKCLYGNNVWAHCHDELAGLNKDFKKMISEHSYLKALTVKDILTASDGTRKILFSLEDGPVIETVIIPCDRGRTTVCVSSQVGCAMNCQFCFTGRMGLRKHLSTAEIVEQAVFARRLFSDEFGSITNVVFMGMGEPLHNIDNVLKASAIMVDEQGLHFSPRKVTVSTSGLVPQLNASSMNPSVLCRQSYATTDEVAIMLMDDAKRLIELVQGIPCKINLISFNPHSGSQFKPTPDEKIIEFRNVLIQAGLVVFVRLSRGDDQMAACGQLGEPGDYQLPLLRVPEKFQVAL